MANPTDLGDIDSLLDDILSSGWSDTPAPEQTAIREIRVPESEPEYPPVPTRDEPAPVPRGRKKTTKIETPTGILFDMPYPGQDNPDEPGMLVEMPARADAPDELDDPTGLYDLGILSSLAAGRISTSQAAEATGHTEGEVQSALATALREVDPGELVKALGLQAVEQQLKSGALYGAVLHDLVLDMSSGRLKPEHKLELAKLLAKVGKLEPKEDKSVGAGGGFTLNISMGQAAPQQITLEAE